MTFLSALETIFIGPLKLLFETIFQIADRFVNHPGISIIFLSLIMNILVLPLYRRADAMQEEARDTDLRLRKGVDHIKKTFSGDERMMILQTYYRQNNYKPTNALNGSISLLLEIPFFMAAYQFLSNLGSLQGISLGPIQNLAQPDGLLVIGGIAINLLPILMTLINVISSALYLKGFPLKTKIQLYGMALFFMVFLYNSPSGLVFYWTLNNIFSLVKTIFYKIKNPKKVLRILMSVLGLAFVFIGIFFRQELTARKQIFIVGIGLFLMLPLVLGLFKPKKQKVRVEKPEIQPNKSLFFWGSACLTVLIGLLIPSNFIAASPQEYIDITYFFNPIWYVLNSVCFAAGTFLVWMRVFYWLASNKGKVLFERLVVVLCGVGIVNYMFFGTNLGVILPSLRYERGMLFSFAEQAINVLVICAVGLLLFLCATKWKRAMATVLMVAVIATCFMGGINLKTIDDSINNVSLEQSENAPHFKISSTGKNVVVIMLDRAYGPYIPYLLNEKPELKEQFAGFTYYSNSLAYGPFTNFGVPPLMGGYEYTPVELNKRDQESLCDKHNEAIRVMPVLFDKNGYEVTVCDPSYANYQWSPDLSIFDEHPDIKTYVTEGYFLEPKYKQYVIEERMRNFFCFGLMKTMPLIAQPTIYNNGIYNQAVVASDERYIEQQIYSPSVAENINASFMNNYNSLKNLPNMAEVTNENINTYLYLTNNLTHETMLLQEPEYVPSAQVDNTAYDAANKDRFTVDGVTIPMESAYQMQHYHTNMAALQQLGNWFDTLREQGAYDNTRIILVSDHGRNLEHFPDMIQGDLLKNLEFYTSLLMVKDFGATEFKTSDAFMTNADVPTLSVEGLIENPINPFTNKPINNDEKTAHDQMVILSQEFYVTTHTGNTFLPAQWASVKDNIWNPENWKFYNQSTVLQEHALPSE